MTISRSIRKRLRRYALLCLVTASTAGFLETSRTSIAEDTHDSGDLCGWVEDLSRSSFSQQSVAVGKLASQAPTPQFLTVSADDQLTIDTCNFDTWLAGILPPSESTPSPSEIKPANTPKDIEPESSELVKSSASRTSSQFNSTLATIAAAASAGNPIPISQWTEPFAMVGPDGSHTPREIKAFQTWFDNGKAFVAGLGNGDFNGFIPVVDFDGKVAGPPNDSIAVLDNKPAQPVTVARPLIGSSPVIATIEEAYQPYDLAAEDLAAASQSSEIDANDPEDTPATEKPQDRQIVWTDGLYSPSLQPFCIHSLDLMRKPGWSPLAQKTISSSEPVAPSAEEEVVAEVEQPEPPIETETLVADAAVEAPADAEPVQEEVVAEVEQPEPPVEAETLVADAAVEAPADAEPMQEEVVAEVEQAESLELVVANPSLPQGEEIVEEVPGYVGSPDCLLEDVIWQVSVAMEDANVTDRWLRPKRVGKRLASLVVGGDRVATRVASELALVWPANAQPAKPIPGSGAKLLARAEAAEQLPAEGTAKPFTPEQLAQADAMFRQWVGVAQSVLDDLSDRLNDVTEVALHRGTQDDSNRR